MSDFYPAQVGDMLRVRGVLCRIYKALPCGTFDVEALDGSGRCWRVSGCLIRVEVLNA